MFFGGGTNKNQIGFISVISLPDQNVMENSQEEER